jgi:hypothetical protein
MRSVIVPALRVPVTRSVIQGATTQSVEAINHTIHCADSVGAVGEAVYSGKPGHPMRHVGRFQPLDLIFAEHQFQRRDGIVQLSRFRGADDGG